MDYGGYSLTDIGVVSTKLMGTKAKMHKLFIDNYTVFQDNCDATGGLYKKANDNAKVQTTNAFEANVYPNPTHNLVNIQTNLQHDDKITIYITDMQGKAILTQECLTSANSCIVNLGENARGIYILKITNSKNETVYKKVELE